MQVKTSDGKWINVIRWAPPGFISSDADITGLQATNGNVFSISNAEYTAVRRKAGLRSDMDIYEIIMFIRINTEQHRNPLKGCGSL